MVDSERESLIFGDERTMGECSCRRRGGLMGGSSTARAKDLGRGEGKDRVAEGPICPILCTRYRHVLAPL
jgi:hypothetical protein